VGGDAVAHQRVVNTCVTTGYAVARTVIAA
jgi:hypothetical protein